MSASDAGVVSSGSELCDRGQLTLHCSPCHRWACSVDVAAVADVETGIPTPELNGGVPVPLNPTPDSSPVPSPPPSGAWRLSTLSCPLLLVAAVAAAVLA